MKKLFYVVFFLLVNFCLPVHAVTKKDFSRVVNKTPIICPNKNTKFLLVDPSSGTETSLRSSDEAINTVYQSASKKYGQQNVKKLLGKEATLQNFENYLACPNLKGIFSIAGHDQEGLSFFLYDGIFESKFFEDHPALNLQNTIISFNTCYAYNDVDSGFCRSLTGQKINGNSVSKVYTAGVTPLPLYGSQETYACFWKAILDDNALPNKLLLTDCARKNDPMVKNSDAPLYLISPHDFDNDVWDPTTIVTNKRTYHILENDQFIRLNLESDEFIKEISFDTNGQNIICPQDSDLFDKPGLKAAEFTLSINHQDSNVTCRITNLKNSLPDGYAVYGISPYDHCGAE